MPTSELDLPYAFQHLALTVSDAVIVTDEEQIIVFVNSSTEALLKYPPGTLIGQPLAVLLPEEMRDRHYHLVSAYGDGARSTRVMGAASSIVARDASGKRLPVTASISTLELDGRRFFIAALRNISAEREALLRLRHMERMRAVGELTGGIAHNFNNLLSVVQGNLELIINEPNSEKALSRTVKAHSAVQAAIDLTNRLLTYSKGSQSGPKAGDLRQSLTGLLPLLSQAMGSNIRITHHFDEDVAPVMVDQGQFENALLSLAFNARDAMPHGGELTISMKNYTRESGIGDLPIGDFVLLTVADTGIGMTQKVLEKAVEPFFTTKTAPQGAGLGLPMVCRFIHEHGGEIRIDSKEHIGTTFSLYFPHQRG